MTGFGSPVARFAAVLAFLVAAPAASLPAEIATATGVATVPDHPRRIAVFDVAAIDTLVALGIAPAGVPRRLHVPELTGIVASAQHVGTLHDPDLEALSELRPDLVVVGGRSSAAIDAVRRVGPAIDMTVGGPDILAQAKARLAAYGRLFGKAPEAGALAASLDKAAARVRAAAVGKGAALVLMTNGPKITAYGASSFYGWMHRDLGIAPAAPELGSAHGEPVSFEFVRRADPDWLIVVDRAAAIGLGDASARATLDNALVRRTKAWRNDRVIVLPAADIFVGLGGIRATERVLAVLASRFEAAR